MLENLVPAMEKVNQPAARSAGRAHLITFCSSYYRNEHLPRSIQLAASSSPARTPPPRRLMPLIRATGEVRSAYTTRVSGRVEPGRRFTMP
jgi:hypothetical protein